MSHRLCSIESKHKRTFSRHSIQFHLLLVHVLQFIFVEYKACLYLRSRTHNGRARERENDRMNTHSNYIFFFFNLRFSFIIKYFWIFCFPLYNFVFFSSVAFGRSVSLCYPCVCACVLLFHICSVLIVLLVCTFCFPESESAQEIFVVARSGV